MTLREQLDKIIALHFNPKHSGATNDTLDALEEIITSSHQAFKAQVLESLPKEESGDYQAPEPKWFTHGFNTCLKKTRTAIEAIPTDV